MNSMRIGTKAIHSGARPDAASGAIVEPITLSTTFERGNEYIYSRAGNPNRANLEEAIASLENGKHAIAFSSGMAAITSVIQLLGVGDRVLSISALYGGTVVYLNQIAPTVGINVDYVSDYDTQPLAELLKPETKLVWLETPTNPTMLVTDIAKLAKQCKAAGIMLAVDNTFSGPVINRPLELGADFVVHSGTKSLNGHADVTIGFVALNDDDRNKTLRFKQNLVGGVPSPFDCWLCHRGLKTLHLRVRQASQNALALAEMLEAHENVQAVNYPALRSSKHYATVMKQNTKGLGGSMLSFRIKGDLAAAEACCARTKLFKFAVSLGGVESLIEVPASAMTHRSLPKDVREAAGIYDNLIRVSVGIEDTEDLLEDLLQALSCKGQEGKVNGTNGVNGYADGPASKKSKNA
ncbi:Cys/Met metabolism PLP-dependent enzyme [Protomyces lactucae-debilis]|uniref:cystathionine gamma-lyase n=1 Tax=Protomyces lactucae-debilis TaxID=2754530 RepID=A0A1Y2F5D1_PROLT|nr:Cys/Met metabolism PLP-dependent enzyme [Protomyces lactucae-debilis]ORY78145.1 Cys/Met metabolism PLP-dependent enzyme [Protomyces lactucae-debilis]